MQKPHQKQLWGALFHCSILFVENKQLQEAPVWLFAVFSAFFQLGAYSAAKVFCQVSVHSVRNNNHTKNKQTKKYTGYLQQKTKQNQLKGQLKVKENYAESSFKVALALYHSPSNEVTPTAQKLESDLSHNVEKIR